MRRNFIRSVIAALASLMLVSPGSTQNVIREVPWQQTFRAIYVNSHPLVCNATRTSCDIRGPTLDANHRLELTSVSCYAVVWNDHSKLWGWIGVGGGTTFPGGGQMLARVFFPFTLLGERINGHDFTANQELDVVVNPNQGFTLHLESSGWIVDGGGHSTCTLFGRYQTLG
jgi:hypothetical protein